MAHGSANPKFGAVLQGNIDDVGQCLLDSAILAGFGTQTHIHAVGDGAPDEQVIILVYKDIIWLYHVCEYLSKAAKSCANDDEENWLEIQKKSLKNNEYSNLEPYLEAVKNNNAPVRTCHRYLSNRTNQLDYKTTIENGLPIGSGEIESAHRYVI